MAKKLETPEPEPIREPEEEVPPPPIDEPPPAETAPTPPPGIEMSGPWHK